MSLKHLLFKQGGIGVSLSRQETIERLNPIIKQHMALNRTYEYLITHHADREAVAQFEAFQKKARADVGKLCETVYSAGGVAYNGVEMEREAADLSPDEEERLFQVRDGERAFQDALAAEFDLSPEHQIRTQAILTNVRTNSQARLNFLDEITRPLKRRTLARS